jgi:hypothetical protein
MDIQLSKTISNTIGNSQQDKNENLLNESLDNFLILSNLTLLTKIQKYEKLIIIKNKNKNKLNFEIKIDNSYLQSIKRWIYSYDRNLTIEYLSKLINLGIEQYHEERKNNNKINMNRFASLLESCKLGLSNLKFTYNEDQTITSKLDVIMESIDVFRINTHSI